MLNAAAFGGYLIDVSNINDGYIEFDHVRISLTREKYWYEIRDVLVPILHIGTNSSRREIYVVVNYRFNKTVRKTVPFYLF